MHPGPTSARAAGLRPFEAAARILAATPALQRPYALARLGILSQKLLGPIDLALPPDGRILDIGSGSGLASAYLTLVEPGRRFVGIELDAARVVTARRIADALGLTANEYVASDVRTVATPESFDGALLLDVLHHIPLEDQVPTLRALIAALRPGGVLVIKDISTEQPFKLFFSKLTDWVMAGLDEPMSFRHHDEWRAILEAEGLSVRCLQISDALPYEHVLLVARRA